MAKRSVWAWGLFVLVVALILFRKRSFANVRVPPKPGVEFYYVKEGESCAEGYEGPLGGARRCQKK